MMVDQTDMRLLQEIADGLPLAVRPYQVVAGRLRLSEADVITRLRRLCDIGVIRRLGVIVRHHELGYRANAMAVWDVPDGMVDEIGQMVATRPEVTLCYRRRRVPPAWPYNLFCMIHGKDRAVVDAQIAVLSDESGLDRFPHAVLYSRRRFKQRGAIYHKPNPAMAAIGGGV